MAATTHVQYFTTSPVFLIAPHLSPYHCRNPSKLKHILMSHSFSGDSQSDDNVHLTNENRGLTEKTHYYENLARGPTSSSPTRTNPSPVPSQHTIPIASSSPLPAMVDSQELPNSNPPSNLSSCTFSHLIPTQPLLTFHLASAAREHINLHTHLRTVQDMGMQHHQAIQDMVSLLIRDLGEENRKATNSTIKLILDNQKCLLVQAEDRLEEKFRRWQSQDGKGDQ